MKKLPQITLYAGLLFNLAAIAAQSDFSLNKICVEKIEAAALKLAQKVDSSANVVGTKLLYGGSRGGFHTSSASIVRISDEVESSDYLVTAEPAPRLSDTPKVGCLNVKATAVNSGSLPDVDGLD